MKALLSTVFIPLMFTCTASAKSSMDWNTELKQMEEDLGGSANSQIGVHLEELGGNRLIEYRNDQRWYLASTIKIFVLAKLTEAVAQNKAKLSDTITYKLEMIRDGAGATKWSKPGDEISLKVLRDRMMRDSDNTATDMLIQYLGIDEIQNLLERRGLRETGPITSMLEVRHQIFSEIHPQARKLKPMDFLEIKKKKRYSDKFKKFVELAKLQKKTNELQLTQLSQAYHQYYQKGLNSGNLIDMAKMLRSMTDPKFTDPEDTKKQVKLMSRCRTGKTRLKKGLGKRWTFAHKTGTQARRSCDVGWVLPRKKNAKPQYILVVCMKDYLRQSKADLIFQKLGKMIDQRLAPILDKKSDQKSHPPKKTQPVPNLESRKSR